MEKEEQCKKLIDIVADNLSEEELDELCKHANELVLLAKASRSRQVIYKYIHKTLIAAAAIALAVDVLWDHAARIIKSVLMP